ncbi:MAG: hypothetical protein PUH21_00990 [Prevotellaceae bacterium]|nr:hypothetical protein [Prevotellaceae bacterium]MDY3857009.1 hypothetical protein [Bacteroidaceae bacterium]
MGEHNAERACGRRLRGRKKKQLGIEQLLGIALGCIHLSYDDFCRLTIDEFQEVYNAYYEKERSQYENGWQRMRMLATITIQPHVRSKITPQRLLPFPWESPKRKTAAEPIVSKEEDLERFKKLTGGMGKG